MSLLGIITALPIEARQVSRDVPSIELPLHIADHALLAVSGSGAEKAARAAERLVQRSASVLASVGFAAALDPTLSSGAVLLPDAILGADGRRYPADEHLHRQMQAVLCRETPVTVSTLLEVPGPITDAQRKAELRERHGTIAIDMESAAIARVARTHHLPFLALRVVLDDARMSLPEHLLASTDTLGRLKIAPTTLALLMHPMEIVSAARLLLALLRARAPLRKAAKALVATLAGTKPPAVTPSP